MRYLIISDIHANWEALEAVIKHTAGKYDEIVCCGDLVGYGPSPNEVCDWVREHVPTVVRGNHDRAAVGLDNLEWFNPVARTAAEWTRQILTPDNIDYVRRLPKGPLTLNSYQIAHGSPLDEDGYLVSATDAAFVFPYVEPNLTFFGHSHLQGGFVWMRNQARSVGHPRIEIDPVPLELRPDDVYLLNPGSIGQPRDHDPRAAYALYDTEERCVYFARESYSVEKVQRKIRDAGLPPSLADRLAVGR